MSSNARVQQEAKNKFETILIAMEDKAQQGLERVLSGIISYVTLMLTKLQQKTDYRPKDTVDDRPTTVPPPLQTGHLGKEGPLTVCLCIPLLGGV